MKWSVLRRHDNEQVDMTWIEVQFDSDGCVGFNDRACYDHRTVFETHHEAMLTVAYLEDVICQIGFHYEVIEEYEDLNIGDMSVTDLQDVQTTTQVDPTKIVDISPMTVEEIAKIVDQKCSYPHDYDYKCSDPHITVKLTAYNYECTGYDITNPIYVLDIESTDAEHENVVNLTKVETDMEGFDSGNDLWLSSVLDQMVNPTEAEIQEMKEQFEEQVQKINANTNYGRFGVDPGYTIQTTIKPLDKSEPKTSRMKTTVYKENEYE